MKQWLRNNLESKKERFLGLLFLYLIFAALVLIEHGPLSTLLISGLTLIPFWLFHTPDQNQKFIPPNQMGFRLNISTLKEALDQQDIVALTDARGIITEANDNFCKISKYSREELIGSTHAKLNSGYHSKSFYRDLYATINSGRPWKGIFCNKAKDGSVYWVDSIVYPQFDAKGEIEGFLAIRHNISEQVHLLETSAKVQKRMEVLLEHSPIGVIELDSKFNLVQMNPAFCKILGYSHSALMGKNISSLTHPDDIELNKKLTHQMEATATRPTVAFRKRYLRKDGTPVWVRTTSNGLPNGHFITAVENIHQLVEQEIELKRNHEQLEKIYSLSKDIIANFDFDGMLNYANKAYEHLTGFAIGELLAMPPQEKFHPEDFKVFEKKLASLRLGKSVHWESRIRMKEGGYRLILWNAVPNLDEKVFYSIGRDITELRQNELKVMNASKMESLSQVASGVAHEINNPLAIIRGRMELIKRQLNNTKPDFQKIQRSLDNTDEMVTRIATIIEALRLFAAPSGSTDYLEDLSMRTILERAIHQFQERFAKENIKINFSIDNQDFSFLGRSREISHSLSMLLANSVEAIPKSQDNRWINISASEYNETVVIKVQDSGPGIPQELINKIMEPFFSTKSQSMGLGLSVASGLIAGHGGLLSLDTSAAYTTFIITLPHLKKGTHLEIHKVAS